MSAIIKSLLLFALAVEPLLAETVVPLPQLNKPNFITAGEGWLCISEESSPVHLFRVEGNSIKFVTSFGTEGEGPGEFNWIHRLRIIGNSLEIPTAGRYARFDMNGKLIEEQKVLVTVLKNQLFQVGQNFFLKSYAREPRNLLTTISLYDSDFKLLKEIGKMEVIDFISRFNPAPDLLTLLADRDTVFICSSTARQSTVEFFDGQGNSLKRIDLPMKACPVTQSLKKMLIKPLREMCESEGEWIEFSKQIVFPDWTPGVKDIFIQGGQIICQGYQRRDDLAEYVLLDLSGKELKRSYHRYFDRDPNGCKYCFYQGRLYYLLDNADEEVWELHIEDI